MMPKDIFIIISCALTAISVVPYVRDILKNKTKPRIVSWFIWMVLAFIAGFASLSDHQYAAAIFSLFTAFEVAFVCVLGAFYDGEKTVGRFDILCLMAAAAGLLLWYLFDSPSIAIIAVITVDLIASLPTVKHSWQRPFEETAITYFLGGLGATFVLFAIDKYKVTSVANPLYLIAINYTLTAVIRYRQKKDKSKNSHADNLLSV